MGEMPAMVAGPNGRELTVSSAITKRMKDPLQYGTKGPLLNGKRRRLRPPGSGHAFRLSGGDASGVRC